MIKHYVGETATPIIVDVGQDISDAIICQLKVTKPDGTSATWIGNLYTQNGLTQYIRYILTPGDIDQSGTYSIQSNVIAPTYSGLGETTFFHIYENNT